MAESSPILETTDLTKSFGSLIAVNGISWSLDEGQRMGILGPNGAGKTTFFNLLTGVLRPTAGSITFHGDDITGLRADTIARRGLIKTFQTNNLFEGETVAANVKFAAQTTQSTSDMVNPWADMPELEERTSAVVEQLNLDGIRDEVVDELSHGDRRKVEIAIALATDPEVILLDEPTSGVSSREIRELKSLFSILMSEGSYTFVLVEHNVEFLMDLVTEVTVMHEGRVLAQDTPERITNDEAVQRVYLS